MIAVDINKGEQFDREYLKLNPNNKIPTIIDSDGPGGAPYTVFESGAILMYLAEKTGLLMPAGPAERHLVIQWLMFQMGSIGPMLGQAHHFRRYAPQPIPYAIDRYTNEAGRLYRVMDRRLGEAEYLAGEYSIADIASFPWIRPYRRQGQDLGEYPNLGRWFSAINDRPAVRRGLEVPSGVRSVPADMDETTRSILFGAAQYAKH